MRMKEFISQFARTSLVVGAMTATASVAAADWSCFQNNCCEAPNLCYGYNPPGHMQCNNQCCGAADNLSGRLDYLYWRPCSEGLELGYLNTFGEIAGSDRGNVINKEHTKDLDFKFDSGFRLGLGYYSQCDCWEANLLWTHFHAKAHTGDVFADSKFSPLETGTQFFPAWERLAGYYPDFTEARWSLDMDLVDLEVGRSYYVDRCFIVRPFVALRLARIDQSYHVEAESDVEAIGGYYNSFTSEVKSTCDFRGIGPRFGLGIEFKLGCGVSLYGQGAGGILYGKFEEKSHEFLTQTGSDVDDEFSTLSYNANHDERCSILNADYTIGLKWEHCFQCCNRSHPFALAVAWEQNFFVDINRFNFTNNLIDSDYDQIAQTVSPKRGDLSTQGLTVSAMIGF